MTTVTFVVLFITIGTLFYVRWQSGDSDQVSPFCFGTTGGDIEIAIRKLLVAPDAVANRGFVIFQGNQPSDFVQYTVTERGLLLNWPVFQTGGPERLREFVSQIVALGFRERAGTDSCPLGPETIEELDAGEFLILDDGLYAQVGKDTSGIQTLTIVLLREIFGVTGLSGVEITLEVDG